MKNSIRFNQVEYSSSSSIAQPIAPNTPPPVNIIDYLEVDTNYIVVKSQDIEREKMQLETRVGKQ